MLVTVYCGILRDGRGDSSIKGEDRKKRDYKKNKR
jgi:hypothetical protein